MAEQTIYTVGGTVQAGGGIYIKRKADDELLELCRQGEFAFILSSRQVGKSSLMVRTAQQLEKENIRSVTIDLSAIGVNVTQDEWYLGILNEIHTALDLKTDIFAWWNQYTQLGQAQRLTNFFKDVLLKEVQEQIVLFFDEIDSTLSIPFSDDFYIAIRSVYNARSTNPDFKRLSFVLVGVATPADLISDNRRTPFNIGHRVEINDFNVTEALPLAEGLGPQATQILTRILQYTGGHPYLTQRLCAYLASSKDALNEQAVAHAVERLFTGEQGKQDNNLQFVRDMLSARSPDVSRVLKTYKDIRSGKIVPDDERSLPKAHLKLSGLVRSEKGVLRVRNEIYNSVFDLQWVQENTPKNWQKVALISLSASLGILMVVALGIFINDFFVGTRVNESIARFISTTSSVDRLASLAKIYNQNGVLSNTDASLQAAQLFYGLSSSRDQLELFRVYGIEQNPALQADLVTVIGHLYVTVADVDPEVDNTQLLETMQEALRYIPQNPKANQVRDEITAWIAGRKQLGSGDYEAALASYNDALSLNPNNHATLYERAKVYVARAQYTDALNDLDAVIAVAEQSAPVIPPTATPTPSPMPASATPDLIQTRISGAGSTSLPITEVPLDGSETPAGLLTTTATPTQPSIATPQSTDIPRVERYESNFTTLIDVINAVRTLIESTPGLRAAVQQNGEIAYTNLQSFGLAGDFSTQQPQTEPPEFFMTNFLNSTDSDNWESFVFGTGNPSKLSLTSSPNGGLLFHLDDGDLHAYYIYKPIVYENISIRMKAENFGQNTYQVSLVCRRSGDKWYEFTIIGGGLWNLYDYSGEYNSLANGGALALNPGQSVNEYEMRCIGNEISLRVNDEEVITYQVEKNVYPDGQVGFSISSGNIFPIDMKVFEFEVSDSLSLAGTANTPAVSTTVTSTETISAALTLSSVTATISPSPTVALPPAATATRRPKEPRPTQLPPTNPPHTPTDVPPPLPTDVPPTP